MWNLKYDTNELIYKINRLTDIENGLVVAKGKGDGGGLDWEFGISRCKLLCIEWINNQILLYSTENYIQYPVINHNGKEFLKLEDKIVCVQYLIKHNDAFCGNGSSIFTENNGNFLSFIKIILQHNAKMFSMEKEKKRKNKFKNRKTKDKKEKTTTKKGKNVQHVI